MALILNHRRIKYLVKIVRSRASQMAFLKGWMLRVHALSAYLSGEEL